MRPLLRRIALPAVLLIALAGACSTNEGGEQASSSAKPATASLVGPAAFAARVDEPDVVTINVHVPDEGAIAGTDLTIPFDEITESSALPTDLDTPLAIYCRSGNMSADAVVDLQAMGYTDVVELEGGFNAWVAGGRPLEPPQG